MKYKQTPIVDNLIALKLLTMLCTPFNEYPAFKSGLIDDKGKYVVPKSKQTAEQKKSITYLDRFVINVKKMINKLPGGENKLKNILSAMVLIKECVEREMPEESLKVKMLEEAIAQYDTSDRRYQEVITLWADYIKQKEKQNEEVSVSGGMPANNTGGVAVPVLPLGQNAVVRRRNLTNDESNIITPDKK